jgi:hypothetical protein
MSQRIHASIVDESIKLSVPYDEYTIINAFYAFYATLPLEDDNHRWGVEDDNAWSIELYKQKRYMTAEQVFQCLSKFTQNFQDRHAIKDRMIGNISVLAKIPYDDIEALAKIHFK